MHGLNMHMGRYEEIDFFDVLGDPYMNPSKETSIHSQVEKQMGLWFTYNELIFKSWLMN